MFSKPCPVCGHRTNTPQFWLPQNWRGKPCKQCGTNIGLPAIGSGTAVFTLLPLALVMGADGVSNTVKVAVFVGVLLVAFIIEQRNPLVVRKDGKS